MASPDQLSIQLYSLRFMPSLDGALDAVKAAGLTQVETYGPQFDDAAALADQLAARGLAATTAHVGIAALREKFDATVAAARRLGIGQIFMPAVPPEQRQSDGPFWSALGAELGEMARRMQGEGIGLGYHNHHWEMQRKDGDKTALDLLFAASAGSPLNWEADVAWLVRGNADPKAVITRYQDRFVAAHVKDIAPAGENADEDGWADIGHGVLDWSDLWRFCRGAGAKWMVLEHDKPSDGARFVSRSVAALEAMG